MSLKTNQEVTIKLGRGTAQAVVLEIDKDKGKVKLKLVKSGGIVTRNLKSFEN